MKINKINENQWKSVRADGNDPRGDLLFFILMQFIKIARSV